MCECQINGVLFYFWALSDLYSVFHNLFNWPARMLICAGRFWSKKMKIIIQTNQHINRTCYPPIITDGGVDKLGCQCMWACIKRLVFGWFSSLFNFYK